VKINLTAFCWLSALFLVGMPVHAQQSDNAIETQVLCIRATRTSPDYIKPWKSPQFPTSLGTGFLFKDEKNFPNGEGLILTDAHVVNMAQTVRVSNGRENRQYGARILGTCNTADFAVLQMLPEDLKTYESRNGKVLPLELGDSDALRVGDKVAAWGYPTGGDKLSKSESGEISRIDVARYVHSGQRWLHLQSSVQINPGNSGCPVLKEDKVVGLAFQTMSGKDRLHYIIPINLVKRLMGVLDKQEVIPHWQWQVQFLNPGLKEFYNLSPEQCGVILTRIIPEGAPYTFGLRANDIWTHIDGHEIDNSGLVSFAPLGQRIFFDEILHRKFVGEPLTVKVIRDGKVMAISGKITAESPRLVSRSFGRPNYFVFSGVAFVELTLNCLEQLQQYGTLLRAKYGEELPGRPYQKIVIISEIFPELDTVGPHGSYLRKRVEKINGEAVFNIEHLYNSLQSLVEQGRKSALIEFEHNLRLVLDLRRAKELDAKVQEQYGILHMKTPKGFVCQ
jgi:S1-C subfamily serine protease